MQRMHAAWMHASKDDAQMRGTLAGRKDGPVGDAHHHTGHAVGERAAEAIVRVQAPHGEPATCPQPQNLNTQSCKYPRIWPQRA